MKWIEKMKAKRKEEMEKLAKAAVREAVLGDSNEQSLLDARFKRATGSPPEVRVVAEEHEDGSPGYSATATCRIFGKDYEARDWAKEPMDAAMMAMGALDRKIWTPKITVEG